MGPLISRQAVEKVGTLVGEAVDSGAELICGGITPPLGTGECFYPPTLLNNVTSGMRIAHEEVFGPVISILTFANDQQALEIANSTPYGLAAFIYTSNMSRAQRFADDLNVGVVGINDPRPITPESPFGGVGASGIGREGGVEGLLEYMDIRLIGTRFV
jgi:succinate-semialdehyde dehydrogenase/glutarate-semialdehyde dehydrogenase